jgi:hypothetical protein
MFDNHPVQHILSLCTSGVIPSEAVLYFDNYYYSYNRSIDEREFFSVQAGEISVDWLSRKINDLKEDWNLSFHGEMKFLNGDMFYLPLIDFNTKVINSEIIEICRYRISKSKQLEKYMQIFSGMKLYFSGRSYHGYGSVLLTKAEWINFTQALLLFNYTRLYNELDTIIDTRWVAHRLLSGYPSLRWSKNSRHYFEYPLFFREAFL